ncbi:OmpA/MotB family protein [Oceanidesulfovibrio marinus]|uniref:OmpA-like domain-containing protein n=1 Tax=Oceanidesulfovibrio marinus TaxID=370038 RepID=A0ABX6NK82_9BACT|nr:OmpA family protein [Oceanidesulfovibrio marinus]QJT10539.1 hypothetical protein E8L03_17150 [Oceanidesulfovibrio marinus]
MPKSSPPAATPYKVVIGILLLALALLGYLYGSVLSKQESSESSQRAAKLESRLDIVNAELEACRQQPGASSDVRDMARHMQDMKANYQGMLDNLRQSLAEMRTRYQALAKSAPGEHSDQDIIITDSEDRLSINILGEILFGPGSSSLRPKGRQLLTELAQHLTPVPGHTVYIIGHTDSVPISTEHHSQYPSNWELSAARAAAVARFLLAHSSIDPSRIAVTGLAAHHPIAGNDTAEGRSKNRRVEILIGPELYAAR